MGTPLITVQSAIYEKLSTDSTMTGYPVYDGTPENSAYPYVVIGEFTEKPFNTFNRKGKDITMVIYIYSRYKGNLEIFTIRQAIDDILDKKGLTLSNHTLSGMMVIFSETLEEDTEEVTKLHIVRYRLWTQETSLS